MMINNSDEYILYHAERAVDSIKNKSVYKTVSPQENPEGYVLGGQAGAGKGSITSDIKRKLNHNVFEINADHYRKYHPDFETIEKLHGKDSSKYTGKFSGAVAELLKS